MSAGSKQRAWLLAIACGLGGLVILDRSGVFGRGSKPLEGEEVGPRDAYVNQTALVERTNRLVDEESAWKDLLAKTQDQWRLAQDRMIKAPSAEVASARLQSMVTAVMGDLGLKFAVSSPQPAQTPLEGESVRVIGLTLDFEAPNPDVVFTLVDRLENMPEARTNIGRLSVVGPGPHVQKGLKVVIELQALAWVGKEG